jgi:hypothetical protein
VDWPQFDGSSSHSGFNPYETTISPANVVTLRQHWRIALPDVADGAPVVAVGGPQDLAIVTTKAGVLVARNLETGALVWSHALANDGCMIHHVGGVPCFTTSSPVITGDYVYGYGDDGRVHKVSLATGVEVTTPPWPVVATLKPWDEKGSSALASAQANGHTYVYATNSGYPGDAGDYQGHVTAIDADNGASKVFNTLCSDQPVHFVAAPGTPDCAQVQSGVWARAGVTYSSATNRIYLATGNATYNPAIHDWGDTVLALNPDGTGTGSDPVDYFTPLNYAILNSNDLDLGSTLPALVDLPMGMSVLHLGVQGGKEGVLKLLNMASLGGLNDGLETVPGPGGEILTAPAVWTDGSGVRWVFVSSESHLAGYTVTLNASNQPQLTQQWDIATTATSPLVANGVLYVAGGTSVRAYNPHTGGLLWTSSPPIGSIHWQSPVVVDGLVLVEDGSGYLTAWGLP